jgi:hypothetical protein
MQESIEKVEEVEVDQSEDELGEVDPQEALLVAEQKQAEAEEKEAEAARQRESGERL